jgi:hypothetical protein
MPHHLTTPYYTPVLIGELTRKREKFLDDAAVRTISTDSCKTDKENKNTKTQ